jgi:hypothetical protein
MTNATAAAPAMKATTANPATIAAAFGPSLLLGGGGGAPAFGAQTNPDGRSPTAAVSVIVVSQ